MQIIDLFSGIGGFSLAGKWMGWNTILFCEKEKFPQRVLKRHWPDVPICSNIFDLDRKWILGNTIWDEKTPTIVTGGFPCQPFSTAGKRKGRNDERYLWPEMLRVIREIKPAYVLGENVAGLISMEDGETLERIFVDLESEGYTVESFVIPACSVGAWHRRNRIWIVAYANNGIYSRGLGFKGYQKEAKRSEEQNELQKGWYAVRKRIRDEPGTSSQIASDSNKKGLQVSTCSKFGGIRREKETCEGSQSGRTIAEGWTYWQTEPSVGRMANGIPNRVDRLKGLGNSIVPQVVYEIYRGIDKMKTA